MFKPDQTRYLAHFTKDSSGDSGLKDIPGSARERLLSILQKKCIQAFPTPWTKAPAVCFTECPWSSLMAHTSHYSPYGIGFNKAFIFGCGRAPVLYVRLDILGKRDWKECIPETESNLWSFLTPFWPAYAPKKIQKEYPKPCDFTHEREWRVAKNLYFKEEHVEFITVNTYDDIADVRELLPNVSLDRILTIQEYRTIETLWPVHRIDENDKIDS